MSPSALAKLQSPEQRRGELARDLVNASYLKGEFFLGSGRHSDDYFDKYLFETKPTVLRRLASLLGERIPAAVDRLAGPELGAVALVAALSLETGLPFVIVRKPLRNRANVRLVEGELHRGESVLIIEDVVSTGSEAIRVADQIERVGGRVSGVLAVIDREHGGGQRVASAGYHFDSLFRGSELPV